MRLRWLGSFLVVTFAGMAQASDAVADFSMFRAPLPPPDEGAQTHWNFPALRASPDSTLVSSTSGVARTLSLLAGSTAQRRNHVRILVYGQSLSKQSWAERVRDELMRRYPHADIEFHNLAIGGFVASMLKRTLEQDVIPLYPDLIILHDFGREDDYEEIVRQIRTRTTAELLLQNDPWTPNQRADWHDQHSWQWMPALAARWGVQMVDIRGAWRDYMADQRLSVDELLQKDQSHLNHRGNFVWAEATLRHLTAPQEPLQPNKQPVRTLVVGKDVHWMGNKLTLPFTGNRIDVIADPKGTVGAAARVVIDGKAPSQWPSLYAFTRPNADANRDWPWQTGATMRVDRQAPLLLEDWTITFTTFAPESAQFSFSVVGSKTGYDGSGESDKPFVSRSGRVVLSPEDWFIERVIGRESAVHLHSGYKITFGVRPQFVDTYVAPPTPDPVRSYVTTLAQGLPMGRHTLQMLSPVKARPLIKEIRVYSPMVGPVTAAGEVAVPHNAKSM